MSANLVIDLGATTQSLPTIALGAVAGSGVAYAASGGIIGQSVNMLHSDTFCNINVAGCPILTSGQLRIAVQTADADVSGSFTDPTSGLAQLPTWFSSGGILILNSGGTGGGTKGAQVSGQSIQSGFSEWAAFQRLGQFARANVVSGDFYAGTLQVSLLANLKTTGSGGGFTLAPTSGVVSV